MHGQSRTTAAKGEFNRQTYLIFLFLDSCFKEQNTNFQVAQQAVSCSAWVLQVEEAKRQRDGKPWSEEEQAAFKAQIAERCACGSASTSLLPACIKQSAVYVCSVICSDANV